MTDPPLTVPDQPSPAAPNAAPPDERAPRQRPSLRAMLRAIGRSWFAAVQFLTRIPMPSGWLGDEPHGADLRLAAAFFPCVGILIGLITGTAIWLCLHLWPAWVAVGIGVAMEALLTGALHEDALADFCDAFGGGWTREDVLRILDDSRVGSFGVLGLVLAVLLRAGTLASLEPGLLVTAAVASASAGRWAMLPAMAALPPVAGRESLAQHVGRLVTARDVLLGGLGMLAGVAPLVWISPWRMAVAAVGLGIVVTGFVAYVHRRIGGMTGDCLGCLCYLAQLWVLLCASAGWPTV